MNTLTKIVLWTFFAPIIGFMLWLLYFNNATSIILSHNCSQDRRIRKAQFRGIIMRKFVDSANHSLKTFYIKDRSVIYEFKISFDQDSVLWTQTKIGDSLKKSLGSNIFLKKAVGHVDTLVISYPCNN